MTRKELSTIYFYRGWILITTQEQRSENSPSSRILECKTATVSELSTKESHIVRVLKIDTNLQKLVFYKTKPQNMSRQYKCFATGIYISLL